MGEIIALGSVNVDVQVRAERTPAPGETLLAKDFLLAGGGKAANVAVLARRLGARARVLGRVGDDVLASIARAPLEREGVDVRGLEPARGASTAVAAIVVAPDGKKGIVLASNANDAWTEEGARAIERAIRDAEDGSVLVVDVEVPPWIARASARAARARGLPVVLDPSPAHRAGELLALADLVVPNAGEAEALTEIEVDDEASARRAGRRLVERGAKAALVKLHDGGCAFVSGDRAFHAYAPPSEVVDKTGAGDAFAGAVAVATLERRSPEDAARFGVAASSFAVGRWGSQASYPTREELEPLLARVRVA